MRVSIPLCPSRNIIFACSSFNSPERCNHHMASVTFYNGCEISLVIYFPQYIWFRCLIPAHSTDIFLCQHQRTLALNLTQKHFTSGLFAARCHTSNIIQAMKTYGTKSQTLLSSGMCQYLHNSQPNEVWGICDTSAACLFPSIPLLTRCALAKTAWYLWIPEGKLLAILCWPKQQW